mgnify:CR=1 FL=1
MNKSSAEQANQALAYIYRSLPTNMRTLLKMRTDKGTDEEAVKLVG